MTYDKPAVEMTEQLSGVLGIISVKVPFSRIPDSEDNPQF